jgi:CHASE3 domain sensor protein
MQINFISVKLSKLVEEKTDQIRKENKEFYKDLESTIKIKLEENKSQIKQIIENERSQIKEIFEIEFAKNTRELRQVIEAETNKQTQIILENQKVIKLSVWIIGGVSIILGAIILFVLVSH